MVKVITLVWNERNVDHVTRHNVTTEEVEQVVYGVHVKRETYNRRSAIIGKTDAGRMLYIVVFPQAKDTYYVVTARSADRKERQLFTKEMTKGGEQNA